MACGGRGLAGETPSPGFLARRASALAALQDLKHDKSPKGSVDAHVAGLVDAVNASARYFTLSSCSGRVAVMRHGWGLAQSGVRGGEGGGEGDGEGGDDTAGTAGTTGARTRGKWLLVSHDPVPFEAVQVALQRGRGDAVCGEGAGETRPQQGVVGRDADADEDLGGLTTLRMEPFILAVECVDVVSGGRLVATAVACGMRESGMQLTASGRVMASLRSTGLRMEAPVIGAGGAMLGDTVWLRALVDAANVRLGENLKKVARLEAKVRKLVGTEAAPMLAPEPRSDARHGVGGAATVEALNNEWSAKMGKLVLVEAEGSGSEGAAEVTALEVSPGIAAGVIQWLEATGRNLTSRRTARASVHPDSASGRPPRLLLPLMLTQDDWDALGALETAALEAGRLAAPDKGRGPLSDEGVQVVRASLRECTGKRASKRFAQEVGGEGARVDKRAKRAAVRFPTALVCAVAEAINVLRGTEAMMTPEDAEAHAAMATDEGRRTFAAQYLTKWTGKGGGLRHERLGRDLAVVPAGMFVEACWAPGERMQRVWAAIASLLGLQRLARQAEVDADELRQSRAVLLGDWRECSVVGGKLAEGSGWVEHIENGVKYCFDVTKCMFASGNGTERKRMGDLRDLQGKTVVDLFAGIGYFTLPFLVRAGAGKVYACDKNPDSVAALRAALAVNGVAEGRCEVLQGDCRHVPLPEGVADHVNLGLLPSAQHCLEVAVRCLKPRGGRLCVHENVREKDQLAWAADLAAKVAELGARVGKSFAGSVRVAHVEKVKSYAPRVWHLVADVVCGDGGDLDLTAPLPAVALAEIRTEVRAIITDEVRARVAPPAVGKHTMHRADATGMSWGDVGALMAHLREDIREPCVVTGVPLGAGVRAWQDVTYLRDECADSRQVVGVHVCASQHAGHLDFTARNFEFHSMPLAELYGRAATPELYPPLIGQGESYYFRSLGARARKDKARLEDTFPEMAAALPPELTRAVLPMGTPRCFSSVLRVAVAGEGPGGGAVHLWPHFDVMDNVLLQGCGSKRVICFPPECDADLHACGRSSSSPVLDVDVPDQERFPRFKRAHAMRREAALTPGDLLYIPALWWHRVSAGGGRAPSVAVNLFWKHMPEECYDPHDLYGNREPPQVRDARRLAEALPSAERRFWFRRLARGDGDVDD